MDLFGLIAKPPLLPYVIPPLAMTYILDALAADKWASLGVGGLIAIVMFWIYREDRRSSQAFQEKILGEYSSILKESTAAMTKLAEIIERDRRH